MIPGDKYPPYALFWLVSGTPLVYHVVEGHLNGFDVAVFDLPGKSGTRTGAIVSGLPVAETPAPPSEGDLRFELQDGHLLGSRSRVPIEDLSSFLESVVSVARRSS
jgi:hypothetical protein